MIRYEHVLVLLARGERPLPRETEVTLANLQNNGARIMRPQHPCSDVCYLRNKLLTDALATDRSTLLLLDDDMVVHTPEVLTEPHELPRSAVYCSRDGTLAASRFRQLEDGQQLWLTGLGAFALETDTLRELASGMHRTIGTYKVFPFCTAGVHGARWEGDDYSFVRRLGGATLTHCRAGHVKPVPLWPDEETMRKLENEETL